MDVCCHVPDAETRVRIQLALLVYVPLNVRVHVPVDPANVPAVIPIVPDKSVELFDIAAVPPVPVPVHETVGAVPTVLIWDDPAVPAIPIVGLLMTGVVIVLDVPKVVAQEPAEVEISPVSAGVWAQVCEPVRSENDGCAVESTPASDNPVRKFDATADLDCTVCDTVPASVFTASAFDVEST